MDEFHRKLGEPFEMPDDFAILKEQERLISVLSPPQPVIFRSNHASNALALAGNLPRDKDKLLLQLREAMTGNLEWREIPSEITLAPGIIVPINRKK